MTYQKPLTSDSENALLEGLLPHVAQRVIAQLRPLGSARVEGYELQGSLFELVGLDCPSTQEAHGLRVDVYIHEEYAVFCKKPLLPSTGDEEQSDLPLAKCL